MDDAVLQQLQALVGQLAQVLQQAGGGGMDGGDPAMADAGMGADPAMMDDPNDPAAGAGVPDEDEAAKMAMRSQMMKMKGGSNLDNRIAALEQHTGLRKAASGKGAVPTADRVAYLEEELLGTEYRGRLVERIEQLEEAAGLQKSAAIASSDEFDDAPDEINLTELLQTAVQAGIEKGMVALNKSANNGSGTVYEELPGVGELRKQAARQKVFNQPKRQRTTIQDDEALTKALERFGWDKEELDKPLTTGEKLWLQYHGLKSGMRISLSDDGDDD